MIPFIILIHFIPFVIHFTVVYGVGPNGDAPFMRAKPSHLLACGGYPVLLMTMFVPQNELFSISFYSF